MGKLIALDFQTHQRCLPVEAGCDGGTALPGDDLPPKSDIDDESDLLMINVRLTNGINDSFTFLADLENKVKDALRQDNSGEYVGWDCNSEAVCLYVTGKNAVTLSEAVVAVLRNLKLTSETVEVLSYVKGEILL